MSTDLDDRRGCRDSSGCGSVWLERCVRDAEAGGSNPLTPTIFLQKKWSTKPPGFTSCGDSRSSLKKRSFFFTSSPVWILPWSGPQTGPHPKENVFHGSMPEGGLPFLKKSCLSENRSKSSGRQIFLFRQSISVQHRQSVGKSFGKTAFSTVAVG